MQKTFLLKGNGFKEIVSIPGNNPGMAYLSLQVDLIQQAIWNNWNPKSGNLEISNALELIQN